MMVIVTTTVAMAAPMAMMKYRRRNIEYAWQ